MKNALAFAFTTALLAGAAHAVDVYKWKDSKGVVHYGERPAAGASAVMLSVAGDDVTEEDEEAANERLDRAREKILEPTDSDDGLVLPPPESRRKKTHVASCDESWQRYDAAAACFSAHRVANGKGVSDAGMAVCKQVSQPTCAR